MPDSNFFAVFYYVYVHDMLNLNIITVKNDVSY